MNGTITHQRVKYKKGIPCRLRVQSSKIELCLVITNGVGEGLQHNGQCPLPQSVVELWPTPKLAVNSDQGCQFEFSFRSIRIFYHYRYSGYIFSSRGSGVNFNQVRKCNIFKQNSLDRNLSETLCLAKSNEKFIKRRYHIDTECKQTSLELLLGFRKCTILCFPVSCYVLAKNRINIL